MRSPYTLVVLATAGVLALAGCGGQSAAAPVIDPYQIGPLPSAHSVAEAKLAGQWRLDGDSLDFTGMVAAGTSRAFAHAAAGAGPAVRTVTVDSPGGDLTDGLPVARYIRDHHLALVVAGACSGPCADYWFPAAAHRTVRFGGWLGFTPDLAMTGQRGTPAGQQEAALYSAAGVDAAALHAALTDELRLAPGAATGRTAQVWMPTNGELAAIGMPGDGHVPLPSNLAAANAHAQVWGVVAAYEHTFVGIPAPAPTAVPTASADAS